MKKKTQQVKELFASGDVKAALRIAKTFRLGVTCDERKTIVRGYECMVNPGFYVALGFDPALCVMQATETAKRLFA